MKKFDVFVGLIKDQLDYGGKKYALGEKQEATDVLFDTFGKNWLYGTMTKYCFRWKNLKRERDVLKIATFSYLLWLKRGFFIDDKRVVPININVELKEMFFEKFIAKVHFWNEDYNYFNQCVKDAGVMIDSIFTILKKLADLSWEEVSESYLFQIFLSCYAIWELEYSDVDKHDTDTWNER